MLSNDGVNNKTVIKLQCNWAKKLFINETYFLLCVLKLYILWSPYVQILKFIIINTYFKLNILLTVVKMCTGKHIPLLSIKQIPRLSRFALESFREKKAKEKKKRNFQTIVKARTSKSLKSNHFQFCPLR